MERYGSLGRTRQFARLFLLPGVYRCNGDVITMERPVYPYQL